MAEKPTQEQFMDEDGLFCVSRIVSDSWRHGVRVAQVFKRAADATYWIVNYDLSTDGETNGLRDGDYSCIQGEPYEATVTMYKAVQ